MSEKIRTTPSPESREKELDEQMELVAAREVILDSAPLNWIERTDPEQVLNHRADIIRWSNDEILAFCKNTYVWDDPSFAQALAEVIAGRTTLPL